MFKLETIALIEAVRELQSAVSLQLTAMTTDRLIASSYHLESRIKTLLTARPSCKLFAVS